MGYSLYWKRPIEINRGIFISIIEDFKKVLPDLAKHKVKLAGGMGQGEPSINEYGIWLNGASKCRHRNSMPDFTELIHLFSEGAALNSPEMQDILADDWAERRCPGSCCFETFNFPRIDWNPSLDADMTVEGFWSSCKTNRRHYELAVQVVLVAAKHFMGAELLLLGDEKHWRDARQLCQERLGYGLEMKLFEEPQQKAA
jgi:hypothetical protein